MRTIIRFSSKFTFLPFLYLQAIYHLFAIIYYGTSLHWSHVISHTLLNVQSYNTKGNLYACVQRICPNSRLPKQTKLKNISWTEHHKYQITHELFTTLASAYLLTRFVLRFRFLWKSTTEKPAISNWYINTKRHAMRKWIADTRVLFSSGKIRQSLGVPNMVHPTNQPTKKPTFPETWGCMTTMRLFCRQNSSKMNRVQR